MTTDATHESNECSPTPFPLRMVVLLTSIIVGVSTLPWIWMSVGKFGGFAWGLFGFELIVLLGALMSLLVASNRVQTGSAWSLAVACFAGTLLVDIVFALYVDANAVVGDNAQISPWINRTIMLRLAGLSVLSVVATLDVYRMNPKSWGMFVRAAIFLIPVIAVLAWFRLKGGLPQSSGEPSVMNMILLLLGGLIVGILFSIGGHFMIRSYEVAYELDENGSKSQSNPRL